MLRSPWHEPPRRDAPAPALAWGHRRPPLAALNEGTSLRPSLPRGARRSPAMLEPFAARWRGPPSRTTRAPEPPAFRSSQRVTTPRANARSQPHSHPNASVRSQTLSTSLRVGLTALSATAQIAGLLLSDPDRPPQITQAFSVSPKRRRRGHPCHRGDLIKREPSPNLQDDHLASLRAQ